VVRRKQRKNQEIRRQDKEETKELLEKLPEQMSKQFRAEVGRLNEQILGKLEKKRPTYCPGL
jgi:hypothetical protein